VLRAIQNFRFLTENLIRDHKEHLDLKDPLACLERKVQLGCLDLQDNEDSLENEEKRVKLDFLLHHHFEEFLVKKVLVVLLETVELLESLV
jgi:hypothetical protein